MPSSSIACLRRSSPGQFDQISRHSLLQLAASTLQKSQTNGWLISDQNDQWQTLLLTVAGLELNQSVFFAGDIFSREEVKQAVTCLTADDTPSFAFLTSGSTGTPKVVRHSIESLRQASIELSTVIDVGGQRMHHLFRPNYMAGILNCVVLPWITGGSIVISKPFSFSTALELPRELDTSQSEVAWLSPMMIRTLTRSAKSRGSLRTSLGRHWKLVISATGPLDLETRNSFAEATQLPILNSYGTTEHLFISAESSMTESISCGHLLPRSEVAFDSDLRNTFDSNFEQSSSGVLWAKTPFMASLVADTRQQTDHQVGSPVIETDFRPTGDVGRLRARRLYIDHRADDLLIWDGLNISPRVYEDFANGIPFVIETMLSVIWRSGRDHLVLFVVLDEGCPSSSVLDEIRYRFRRWEKSLPAPSRVMRVTDLPRTHTGKTYRRGASSLFEIADAQ